MKKIQVGGHNKVREYKIPTMWTKVSDEDYEYLNQWKWYATLNGHTRTYYVYRNAYDKENKRTRRIIMHREIMNPPRGLFVDHINHDTLDNRRCNLRIVTNSQNIMNSGKHRDNASGLKGVSWHKYNRKWQAQIRLNWKSIYLGYFETKELAHRAYIKACKKYHKEFANYK